MIFPFYQWYPHGFWLSHDIPARRGQGGQPFRGNRLQGQTLASPAVGNAGIVCVSKFGHVENKCFLSFLQCLPHQLREVCLKITRTCLKMFKAIPGENKTSFSPLANGHLFFFTHIVSASKACFGSEPAASSCPLQSIVHSKNRNINSYQSFNGKIHHIWPFFMCVCVFNMGSPEINPLRDPEDDVALRYRYGGPETGRTLAAARTKTTHRRMLLVTLGLVEAWWYSTIVGVDIIRYYEM